MFDPNRYAIARTTPRRMASPFWLGHIPFAFSLVDALRPHTIVELGTYSGSSLAALCQAVEAVGLSTRCYGIDSWAGDVHMSYDESVYDDVSQYMKSTYPGIAELVRARFDDAVDRFADASIDLLHIDGTHTYEGVSNDYRKWLPKLSDRGVMMFHDIHVTEDLFGAGAQVFGVRRFFDEVKYRYPHFEFSHSCGLGVLVVGRNISARMNDLLDASQEKACQKFFATLGNGLIWEFERNSHGLLSVVARRAVRSARRLWRRGARGIWQLPSYHVGSDELSSRDSALAPHGDHTLPQVGVGPSR